MTTRRLNRTELEAIVGRDPRALRAFERILREVQANIAGQAVITLSYNSSGSLSTPLPLTVQYTLAADGGEAFRSGVQWGVVVTSGSFSAAPTIGGTGSGILQINGGLNTPTATLAITARVDGKGYPPFSVTVNRSTAPPDTPGGGGTASDSTSTFIDIGSNVFAPITRELMITLPTGVTDATLTAGALSLSVDASLPIGTSTVELKWQRETAPSVWSDVGVFATSSPDPEVIDTGFVDGLGNPIYLARQGAVTCNRTETGMPAASAQKFRLVGRISAGNNRPIVITGTASASS